MSRIGRGQRTLALTFLRGHGAGFRRGRPRLAITMGDPAGIGPEVVLKALSDEGLRAAADLVVVGDPVAMGQWAELLSLSMRSDVVDAESYAGRFEPGKPTVSGAAAALAAIEKAAALCLSGEVDGMVTAPVSKAAIAAYGRPFIGHTEFLAELTGAPDPLMVFVRGRGRIALATTHLPLALVPGVITTELIRGKLTVLSDGLRAWFGLERPRIAVAALNPHAGENGTFGDEEERVIGPAISHAVADGIAVEGPFAADSIFCGHGAPESGGPGSAYDAILAMYHDQGTVAAKLMGFGETVNVTFGLPIVRTSVDHGTAFELAGRGVARPGSMAAAIRLAAEMAERASGRAGGGGERGRVETP